MKAPQNLPRSALRPGLIAVASLALLVFASAAGAILLSRETGRVAGIWIANAIVLAFVLRSPRSHWLHFCAAAFVGNTVASLSNGTEALLALGFSAANLVEILLVAIPLHTLKLHRNIARLDRLLAFYAIAAGPAPARQ